MNEPLIDFTLEARPVNEVVSVEHLAGFGVEVCAYRYSFLEQFPSLGYVQVDSKVGLDLGKRYNIRVVVTEVDDG